jgi:hypothetical protein
MTRNFADQIPDDSTAEPHAADVADVRDVKHDAALADRRLVDRCVAGDVAAWERLYRQCHAPLCSAIGALVGQNCCDSNLIDEIAARVWYALVRNDGELLDRFDPSWNLRLGSFLRGLARIELMKYFRAEQRHRAREAEIGCKPQDDGSLSDPQFDAMFSEFTATLTPGEQHFLERYLLVPYEKAAGDDPARLSDASIWQRRHRLRSKLRTFFRDEG